MQLTSTLEAQRFKMILIPGIVKPVMADSKYKSNCEDILKLLRIEPTQIRIEIVRVIISKPDEIFTIEKIHKRLATKIKTVSRGTIGENMLAFKSRGMLVIEADNLLRAYLKQPGRPATKYRLSKEFLKRNVKYF